MSIFDGSSQTLSIKNVNFKRNIVGMSLSGLNNASVLSCNFICKDTINKEVDDRFIGGLFLDGCSGYHIEDNVFHPPLMGSSSQSISFGMAVKNSGDEDNEIYNNSFSKLNIEIVVVGENRGSETGLCLKCNEMANNINDIIVIEDEEPTVGALQGIAEYQGIPDTSSLSNPAGNTFTPYNSTEIGSTSGSSYEYWNYYNDAEDIWYVHHFSEKFSKGRH